MEKAMAEIRVARLLKQKKAKGNNNKKKRAKKAKCTTGESQKYAVKKSQIFHYSISIC